jgi:hypothetical protein
MVLWPWQGVQQLLLAGTNTSYGVRVGVLDPAASTILLLSRSQAGVKGGLNIPSGRWCSGAVLPGALVLYCLVLWCCTAWCSGAVLPGALVLYCLVLWSCTAWCSGPVLPGALVLYCLVLWCCTAMYSA